MDVFVREKCGRCSGAGVVTHAAWDEYNELDEKIKKETGQYQSPEECEEWFRNKGFTKLPPEEPTCSDCDGVGNIEKWITAEDFIATTIVKFMR